VGDFGFGRVFEREQDGGLREVRVGKLATRGNPLLAELIPTPKILAELRGWFPDGFLAGWKYEVDGTQAAALEQAREQLAADRTDVCVLNGPAYGAGFGWVEPGVGPRHLPDRAGLADAFLAALGRCGF
jgi:phosphopantothenoylcysteine decarboxylase/phosphopantothenate--cysteine ligase